MKPTTPQILQWMASAAAILQALEEKNETIEYGQLLKTIGMTPNGWKGRHSEKQSSDLLFSLSLVEDAFHITTPLPYHRVVAKATGKPGAGFYTRNKITRIKEEPPEKKI